MYTVSPSQISTRRTCFRRWGWIKLAGLEDVENPTAAFGEGVHGHLERWRKNDVEPPPTKTGNVARKIVENLRNRPMIDWTTENKFEFEYGGVTWSGRKDLEYRENGRLVVDDYKTISDLARAKTPEEIQRDPQGIIYPFESFQRVEDDELDMELFYTTRAEKSRIKPVRLTVLRDDVEHAMRTEMLPIAQDLVALRENPVDPLTLPYELSCALYPPTGCPFVGHCTDLTAGQRLVAILRLLPNDEERESMPNNDLAARLAVARKNAAPVTETPQPTGPTLAEKIGLGVNPQPYTPPPPPPADDPGALVARLAGLGCTGQQAYDELVAKFPELPLDEAIWLLKQNDLDADIKFVTVQPTGPKAKRGPGRPPKVKPVTSTSATLPAPAPVVIEEAAPAFNLLERAPEGAYCKACGAIPQAPDAAGPPVTNTLAGFTLLVNALPEKGHFNAIHLADILVPVHAGLRDIGVKHYKLAEYGKGTGLLVEGLRQLLEQNPLPAGAVVLVDARTAEGADCLGLLTSYAETVVRGA